MIDAKGQLLSIVPFTLNLENAVHYHDGKFPPLQLDYAKLVQPLSQAASAIARYDQMLKTMRSSEIFLAPLRNQEAVISSRMEGTVSTMDEILQYEADYGEGNADSSNTRSEVIETYLYQKALKSCQQAIENGQPFSPVLMRMAHKDQYIDTMRQVSQTGDWTSWCVFFLDAVEHQATKNLEAAENIRDLYEKMKARFSELLSSRWSVNALDFVFTNPVFRNSKFKNGDIPQATAARFAKILEENGLLTVLTESSGRRSTLYRFEPLMELVRV